MYVCLCKGITDRDIMDEMDQGARNLRDISKSLGVGSQCGRCCQSAKEVIQEYKAESRVMSLAYSAA
ncbi:MAG: (2Fe-2S)-binding protein [Pseudomonadales bacterium]|jgi:bacterioferritin-associated ferredoxin|nr:(2Fe-2S)-binding protein [Pseudomonadales bacterium]MCP5216151.1 (2Fe-2S)-binding protein [Pseudomonadales bacterium]